MGGGAGGSGLKGKRDRGTEAERIPAVSVRQALVSPADAVSVLLNQLGPWLLP